MSDQLLYKIALTQIPMVGSVLAKTLVSFTGSPEAVFSQKKSDLLKIPGVGLKVAENIVRHQSLKPAELELEFVERRNLRLLFYLDKEYPIRLKRIKDAPVLLYCQGNVDLNVPRILSIVGTRKASNYGLNQCDQIISNLASSDVMIVSGLAYGIDIASHRKSVALGLTTVGVLGSGLDRIYPAAHRKTAQEMIEGQGALITEYGQGTKPDKENFPMRNRIIAGMCDALLVIESDIKGGSMITAEMANGYHKDVFAIPGRVGDQYSRGCNFLIKTNRAHLVETGNELADYMQWSPSQLSEPTQIKLFDELTSDEQTLYKLLQSQDQISIDRIYKEVPLTVSQIASILLNLEFKGLVRALPGKMYMTIR